MIKNKLGSITPALLILVGSFIVVVYAILLLLAMQLDFSNRDIASQQALHIAEAGINYYRWHLIEDSTDYWDGQGPASTGPYVHAFEDQESEVVGTYSLEIVAPSDNSDRVEVVSTGWNNSYPGINRTIRAVFSRRPLTAFAFLHNSNIWFGQEITINGPVFTNGGIRMDGTNMSTVSTTKETYTCGIETGCSEPTEKPGIWGNGGPQELWQFPRPMVDFDSINVDFSQMKVEAQTVGLYIPPSSQQGYHVIFNSDGTFTVNEVISAQVEKGYSFEFGCENLVQEINNENFYGTFDVIDAPIIFVEDQVWVEGTLNGNTTVVAARFPVDTDNADIWIPNNLVYLDKSGDHKLGLIAQKDINFAEEVPEEFEVNGGLLAQKGRVIRHHYKWHQCSQGGGNEAIKEELTIYGSIISNLSSYWNFSGGPGIPASGFIKTTISYDPELEADPPDYFPSYGTLELISWQEE